MTWTIVGNLLLGLALVTTLLWLLGHLGANKDRDHERRLHGWHALRKRQGRRPPEHVADI